MWRTLPRRAKSVGGGVEDWVSIRDIVTTVLRDCDGPPFARSGDHSIRVNPLVHIRAYIIRNGVVPLLLTMKGTPPPASSQFSVYRVAVVVVGAVLLVLRALHGRHWRSVVDDSALCPQSGAIYPVKHADLDSQLERVYQSKSFQLDAYEKLGGSIRVPLV